MTPQRELLWNIDLSWIMYPCFLVALAVAVYFFVRKYRLWKIGAPENRTDNPCERLKASFFKAILNGTLFKERSGIMHVFMYVGFVIMLFATVFTAIQADLGVVFLYGDFYLYFMALIVDLAGFAFVVAMVALIVRRLVSKKLESKPSDYIILAALLLIGVSGFIVEGLRIVGTDDPWRIWSPIGNIVAYALAGLSAERISIAHRVLWWGHMALAFTLIATWTYSKLVHVLLIPATVYTRSLEPMGTLPYINVEDEELLNMGVGKLEEFTWKDLMDTEACVRCGRCHNNCPANLSGKALSPMHLMEDLRGCLEERSPVVTEYRKTHGMPQDGEYVLDELEPAQRAILEKPLVGGAISSEALWACTTCGSCMEQCPALLEHVPKIVKMRIYQTSMESQFPSEAQTVFRNLENNGNPWGLGWQTRAKWSDGLDIPTLAENPTAEYLFWPGCSGAMDARSRKVTIAFAKLLKQAGVDFAILGNEEKCCGDSARRLGNEYVYFLLASENIDTLDSCGVKKIVTTCPHCLNTLGVDYPQLGGHYEVIHHSELLAQLVASGKLKAATGTQKVAFHDSCYLGRYHGVYEQPREVVRAAGCEVAEMERNHGKSFCCGAGGGRMWLEENSGERINSLRAQQALDTKAGCVATCCPFCLTMLCDGVAPIDESVKVKDIAELLLDAQPDAS